MDQADALGFGGTPVFISRPAIYQDRQGLQAAIATARES